MKKRLAILLVLVMMFTSTTVFAANDLVKINVELNRVHVNVNGEVLNIGNLLYNSKTYIQLRDVAETLNKKVEWDQSTWTAKINDTDEIIERTNQEKKAKTIDSIYVQFNAVTVYVNGVKSNAENILHNGVTYVQLRDISELLNLDVSWEAALNTAYIKDKDPNAVKPDPKPVPEPSTEPPVRIKQEPPKITDKTYDGFPYAIDFGAKYNVPLKDGDSDNSGTMKIGQYLYTDGVKIVDINSYITLLKNIGFIDNMSQSEMNSIIEYMGVDLKYIQHTSSLSFQIDNEVTAIAIIAVNARQLAIDSNPELSAKIPESELNKGFKEAYGANFTGTIMSVVVVTEKL